MLTTTDDFETRVSGLHRIAVSEFAWPCLNQYFNEHAEKKPYKAFFDQCISPNIALNFKHESHRRCLFMAVGNAIKHGNGWDPSMPLKIAMQWFENSKLLVEITNGGSGFDYNNIQKMYENNQQYYKFGGNGFKAFNESSAQVTFDQDGKRCRIFGLSKWQTKKVPIASLMIKSDRLRAPGIIKHGAPTVDVRDLVRFLKDNPDKYLTPIWVYPWEGHNSVMDGRHRFTAHVLAGRTDILAYKPDSATAQGKIRDLSLKSHYQGPFLAPDKFVDAVIDKYPEYGLQWPD